MGAPQIIVIVWLATILGASVAKHGEPFDPPERNCFFTLLRLATLAVLLGWGGFWG